MRRHTRALRIRRSILTVPRLSRGVVATLAAALTYLFWFEYLPPFNRIHLHSDIEGYHWPLLVAAHEAIRHGRFPLWDSSIYCGIPFSGNIQAALFYPRYGCSSPPICGVGICCLRPWKPGHSCTGPWRFSFVMPGFEIATSLSSHPCSADWASPSAATWFRRTATSAS